MTSFLPHSSPEAQGLSSRAVQTFLEATESAGLEMHAFVLLRRGHLIAQGAWAPFRLERPHVLFSVSKSFTSTALGLAVQQGLLGLDDAVLSFFPEFRPAVVSEHLAGMRVRDLLTMTTGHAEDLTEALYAGQPQPWAQTFLAAPVAFQPGTHFVYNSAATYMLAALLERLSGQPLPDYLRPRLFGPLGIDEADWQTNAEGVTVGGWGLKLKTEDLASLGQLYLGRGVWKDRPALGEPLLPWRLKDRRLLSEDWVEQATAAQVRNDGRGASPDWEQGYGFQFWRCQHGAYRADGALGQFIVVLPEQDAVLAINSAVDNMQVVLDLVWTHLLPAFEPGNVTPEPGALERLRHKCETLQLAPVAGALDTPQAVRLGGRSFTLEPNVLELTAVEVGTLSGEAELILNTPTGRVPLRAAFGGWAEGTTRFDQVTTLDPGTERRMAASAAWSAPDTLELHLKYLETAGTHVLKLHFGPGGETLRLESSSRTSFRPLAPLTLEGTLQR